MSKNIDINLDGVSSEIIASTTYLPRDDETTPIDFRIPARPNQIVPIEHILLNLQLQVLKTTRESNKPQPLDESDLVCLINYPLNTLFLKTDVYVKGDLVTYNNNGHAWTSMLMAWRSFNQSEKRRILSHAGWEPDFGSELINEKRRVLTRGDKIDLSGRLMVDVLNQNMPFPDDADVIIKLYRNRKEFVLNAKNIPAGTDYVINILKANLEIKRYEMPPGRDLYKAFNNHLDYIYYALEPKHFVLPGRIKQINQEICDGILPLRVMVVFLPQEAFNGDYAHDPFYFHHFKIRKISLKYNGIKDLPSTPYSFELGNVSIIESTPGTARGGYTDEMSGGMVSDTLSKPSKRKQPPPPDDTTGDAKPTAEETVAVDTEADQILSAARAKHPKKQPQATKLTTAQTETVVTVQPETTKSGDAATAAGSAGGTGGGTGDQAAAGAVEEKTTITRMRREIKTVKTEKTITNFTRSFLSLAEAFGFHENTELTYDEFRNGKFIPTWDLRINPNPDEGELLKTQKGTLSLVAEFHEPIMDPLVMLCFFEKQRVMTIQPHGGGVGHI